MNGAFILENRGFFFDSPTEIRFDADWCIISALATILFNSSIILITSGSYSLDTLDEVISERIAILLLLAPNVS